MGKLYTALRAANVPEAAAVDAAEEIAGFENRLSDLTSEVKLIKWMLSFNLALTVAVVVKLFLH